MSTQAMPVMEVTLPGGLLIKGNKEAVLVAIKQMGYSSKDLFPEKEYYESSSKGLVLIKDMATEHLKNAVAKKMTEYIASIKKEATSGRDFVDRLTNWGHLNKSPNLLAMIKELNSVERQNKDLKGKS